MKYCNKMFHDLNFEPHSISPCCNTQNIIIPSMPYEGGPIDLRAYGECVSNAFEEIQAGGKICRGCGELADGPRPASHGLFHSISLNMHRYLCNCRCVYCTLWTHKIEPVYDVVPGLKSLKAQGALAPHAVVSWGGGEPGIYKDFEKTAVWLLQNHHPQYIHTNAIRHSPVIESILKYNLGKINISLDSAGSATYKTVKGVDCFDKVVTNLENYAKANADAIELKYIIFEQNNDPGEVRRFIDLAKRTGIKRLQFSLDFREQNAGTVSSKTLMSAAAMILMAQAANLNITPFFVRSEMMEKIKGYVNKLDQE